ncbi:MFS transporter [Cupriavidus sp. AU9028]|uniref:MFS transporter n=1 Tax=Cupriavidus sp. AU9028 TaxID=2871157 RepID=UPI001C95044A|nr:MFS transporter [Cupriavidus sp. AU9028]MBY4899240.1 MFS transporter [Cupriavidus sp. AU9028]
MAATPMSHARVLAICQALFTSALSVDLTLTGLVGYTLAPDKALATLPFALITVAAAVTAFGAAFVIGRLGRRLAFCIGGLACTAGGAVSVWAIARHDFVSFCVGTALVGVFQAFARYYRLAAADAAPAADKPRAISAVLTGGVAAAVCGPAIAAWSMDLLMPPLPFAGAYAVVAAFGIATVLVLLLAYREPPASVAAAAGMPASTLPPRPMAQIVRQPAFLAAFANNGIGNAVMMFVMTATPIAAVACNHTIAQGAQIIEWHLVGMYAPSFVAGLLLQRYGTPAMLMAGIALSALASVVALASTALPAFFIALLCLGIGWNFMFVGGTTLLASCYQDSERARTQAVAEFAAAVVTAIATLAAGQVLHRYGWEAINLAALPALALALVMTLAWQRGARTAAAVS